MAPHASASDTSTGSARPRAKKVFDIVPPGKTLASPTSRPIIVSDKPAVKDEQMLRSRKPFIRIIPSDAQNPKSSKKDRPLMKGGEKVRLQPVSKDLEPPTAPAIPDSKKSADDTSTPKTPIKLTPAKDAPAPSEADAKPELAEVAPTSSAAEGASHQKLPDSYNTSPVAGASELDDPLLDPAAAIDVSALPSVENGDDIFQSLTADSEKQDSASSLLGERLSNRADTTPLHRQPQSHAYTEQPEMAEEARPDGRPQPVEPAKSHRSDPEGPVVRDTYRREDLLSGAGMVMPTDEHRKMIISHHKHKISPWMIATVIILIIAIALAATNFLIDADIIKTDLIPTTNLL